MSLTLVELRQFRRDGQVCLLVYVQQYHHFIIIDIVSSLVEISSSRFQQTCCRNRLLEGWFVF